MTPEEIEYSHYGLMQFEKPIYLSISAKDYISKLSSRFWMLRLASRRNEDRSLYFLRSDEAEQAEHELSPLLENNFKRYEELVFIKERICEVTTVVIILRYSFQFSENSLPRPKALALFGELKEHDTHNRVWSFTLKTLHQEFCDYQNQRSVYRTIPLIKILCSITRLSFQ
jgi:hypothetical protein